MQWIIFDFLDIILTPGQTYYIIWTPDDSWNENEYIGIGWSSTFSDRYHGGEAYWFNEEGEWKDIGLSYKTDDFCFKTYGIDNPPETPTINGPSSGKPGTEYEYTISTTDPEGHDVSYCIDGGMKQVKYVLNHIFQAKK